MQREGLREIQLNPYQAWRRSYRFIDKILCNRTRSYKNSMESYSVLPMILGYYSKDHTKTYRILQYPREYYKIVQDPMGWVWDVRQAQKASTALCKILNSGIMQSPSGSHRILDKIL